MKMIRAIVRPDRDTKVVRALEEMGVEAVTKIAVTGRARQGGADAGHLHHADVAKVMLIAVVEDAQVDGAVAVIARAAHTGFPGDGRIFVSEVERAVELGAAKTAAPHEMTENRA